MNNSDSKSFRNIYSHIYVEEAALSHPRTRAILASHPSSEVIQIKDYKHVFNRPHQASALQKLAPDLILAVADKPCLYPGAAVCQSFGEEHFYYTSCVMNCPFDCEYCYLQGMYPSGNIVIFVNLEDTFAAVDELLAKHPLYLCISFDTDLLALEGLTGFLKEWCDFLVTRPSLTVEVRTKSAAMQMISSLPVLDNMIFAITMSPKEVVERFEHRVASFSRRLETAKLIASEHRQLRLCFDPMIAVSDWEQAYKTMFCEIAAALPADAIRDVSVGSFRISVDYLKSMRQSRPCEVTTYPYTLTDGVYHYDDALMDAMNSLARNMLSEWLPDSKIFFWEEQQDE